MRDIEGNAATKFEVCFRIWMSGRPVAGGCEAVALGWWDSDGWRGGRGS